MTSIFPSASIPSPKDNRKDAKMFLEHHGILSVVPPIRSSDLAMARANPLLYYLSKRLGIVHAMDYNEALAKGTWAHLALEYEATSPDDLAPQLERRVNELKATADRLGTPSTWIESMIQREKEDLETTLAWFSAYRKVPVTSNNETIDSLLSHFTVLGREVEIRIHLRGHDTVVAYDALLHDPRSNEIWILDLKTCSEPTDVRLATAPWEFQTLLYQDVLATVLADKGAFLKTYPEIPTDVKPGGMIHWACQKPQIRISGEDRDFTVTERVLKSGPNKGQIKREKVYEGEPKYSNYLRRVEDWALASGDYLHERATRELQPVTDLSYTQYSAITKAMWDHYQKDYEFLKEQATLPAYPANYPPVASEFRKYRNLSKYAVFMAAPVLHWPEIIANEGFIISHRSTPMEI